MTVNTFLGIAVVTLGPLAVQTTSTSSPVQPAASAELHAVVFDAHWERLRDAYPYFDLYGVDWEAERAEHRPRALAAADPTELAWELARMLLALPDPHLSFQPAMDTFVGWAIPEVETRTVERRSLVLRWPEGSVAVEP